jgi:hypothetical protein
VRGRLVIRLTALLLALPLAGGAARSDTRVLLDRGRVSIHSESAPLADILTRFAQATGAKVVYEAARPRQLVSVVIDAGSAAEAIAMLLEGLGLNYVLRLDPTGQNVEMLIVTGSAGPPAASAGATRAPRSPLAPPPEEMDEVSPGEADQPFVPDTAEGQDPSLPPGTSPEDAMNPALAAPWPGVAPGTTPGLEPSNPEAPSGSAAPEAGQPQLPVPASYPGSAPGSPPVPPPPVYPGPASYPASPRE